MRVATPARRRLCPQSDGGDGSDAAAIDPEAQEALARYQAGKASDAEMVSLLQQLVNTGSIQALRGVRLAGEGPPRVWATIIPVGGGLDIWVDGERLGSASTIALARYRLAAAAGRAKITWTDSFTAYWEREGIQGESEVRR